jgi:anti-sigma B factor antagonist
MPGMIDFGLRDEPVDERTHVVAPRGEVDSLTAPQLGRRLLGLVDDGKRRLVVDLSSVTFMDSTGIGVLLNALRQLASRRGQLVLVCPTERVIRPFKVTGLVGYLPIFRSREEALGGLATAWR